MKLIIVRHGETRWNKENKLQGQADNLLSKNGLKQAKLLAERLRNQNIQSFIPTSRVVFTKGDDEQEK